MIPNQVCENESNDSIEQDPNSVPRIADMQIEGDFYNGLTKQKYCQNIGGGGDL